ncbi:MAG: hypothetical protein AB8H86_07055 [Polyangiales bacterium]
MTQADGSLWAEFGFPCVAMGWLGPQSVFSTGPVAPAFFGRLMELLIDPWQPAVFASFDSCDLCQFTNGPAHVSFGESRVGVGERIVFVPSETGELFVAPSLIAHYIDAHHYQPPARFVSAVTKCPPMRSMAYLRALLACGVKPSRFRSFGGPDAESEAGG